LNAECVARNSDLEEKEVTRAKNTAYRYLSYRPRSRTEVEAKLRDKEFGDAVITAVLADLVRLGYLDDEKFASQWAAGRVRLRSFGRRRVERELRDKGVDGETVTRTLGEVLPSSVELATAKEAAGRKLRTLQSFDRETRRRRLAGYLERKGFSYDVIGDVLRNIDKR
jgi:regulatory protein